MTGKGDRWGRDRIGRPAPAFLRVPAPLYSPHLPARREAGRRTSAAVVVCCKTGQLWAVCVEACAGRRVHRLCPPAVACSAGCFVCLPYFACHAHCPHQVLAPIHFALPPSISLCFSLFPYSCPCAPGSPFSRAGGLLSVRASSLQAARTVPLAAATRACSGGPCTGPFV